MRAVAENAKSDRLTACFLKSSSGTIQPLDQRPFTVTATATSSGKDSLCAVVLAAFRRAGAIVTNLGSENAAIFGRVQFDCGGWLIRQRGHADFRLAGIF